MSITAKGSSCKLCKRKGGKCHLHGGSPKKASPKKRGASLSPSTKEIHSLDDLLGTFTSPSKRSPPKKTLAEFHFLEALPKPVLQEVLLNMKRPELKRVCANVPVAFRICMTKNFQRTYNARHPEMSYTHRGDIYTDFTLVKTEIRNDRASGGVSTYWELKGKKNGAWAGTLDIREKDALALIAKYDVPVRHKNL